MKLKNLLQLFILCLLLIPEAVFAQGVKCFDNLRISLRYSDDEAISVCQGDGQADLYRFGANRLVQPVGYVVTDENNVIVLVSRSNIIDFEGLPTGNLKVHGFYYIGAITATVGESLDTAILAAGCFSLSENVFPVSSIVPDGGVVSSADGLSSVFTCPGDGNPDVISFSTTSTDASYAFVVVDEENNILAILEDTDEFDFDAAPPGICRVWGVSYVGDVTAMTGDNIETVSFASNCFDISDNYLEVIRTLPDGGTVGLTNGSESVVLCNEGTETNVINFSNNTESPAPYLFVLTDDSNVILEVLSENSLDLNTQASGNYRLWGLSFIGSITAAPGDNAAEVALSDNCFDLSDNFIEIIKKDPEGGSIQLSDGSTETTLCVLDGVEDVLSFSNDSESAETYVYLITTETNELLTVAEGDNFDFDGGAPGICRVWGLSYSGNLLFEAGDLLEGAIFSDECFDLSDNFINVIRKQVDGSTVSLVDGSPEAVICLQEQSGEVVEMANASTASESYAYVLTDENNDIISISTSASINLENTGEGTFRIWGLSYSGDLRVQTNANAASTIFSEECFDLSDNFVTINRKEVDGATMSLADGSNMATICVNDGSPDLLEFINTSSAAADYFYILTNDNNEILFVLAGSDLDFDEADPGLYRVWGVSLSGEPVVNVGDNIREVAISNECFDLSDNFVSLDSRGLDAGTVSLADGGSEALICLDGVSPTTLNFIKESTDQGAYLFIITDENNVILGTSESGEIDFSDADPGICRVWGLSYTGNLLAEVGDTANLVDLSDECFDLTENFVTINRKEVDGGTISFGDGTDLALVCSDDEIPDLLDFANTSTANADYFYLLTNDSNEVLFALAGTDLDFDVADPGVYRVWGASITGELLVDGGDNAAEVALSSECYELSDNFLTIEVESVEGGTVSMPSGEDLRYICPNDGNPDIVKFTNTGGRSTGSYIYVITDDNNIILATTEIDSMDFDAAEPGICRIWGLAYSGNLLAQVGDDAASVVLADGCYDLSTNFITLIREVPEGGSVQTPEGETVLYTCPGDEMVDRIFFDSTGTSNTPYGYIITDENNVILGFVAGDNYDFEDSPPGVCRVWGLAYTGELQATIGDTAALVALSDDCYDLSDNFIEINREAPEGGVISLVDGSDAISLCENEDGSKVVRLTNSDASSGPYGYLVLEEQEEGLPLIVGFTQTDSFDFETLDEKNYLVQGLAYTGEPSVSIGSELDETTIFSDDCFDLSDNTIAVSNIQPDGGTLAVEGILSDTIQLCVGDGNPDSLFFNIMTSSTAFSNIMITDGNGIFLTFLDSNVFDFENVSIDTFQVYHVSFTGTLSLSPGDDINESDLASGCAELSAPITILTSVVDGGRLLTASGQETELICKDDGIDDIITFFNTSSAPNASYKYVVATEDGIIIQELDSTVIDVTNTRLNALQIWGVSYVGAYNTSIGSNVNEAVFSDECFVLSDNPVQLFIDTPEGGIITTEAGDTDLTICIGADPSLLEFVSSSSSRIGYAYILTNEADTILQVLNENNFEFANIEQGTYRIWAVSYSGQLTATSGADVFEIDLATGCFELSANFIEVKRFGAVKGGGLTTLEGPTLIYTCPNDGMADLIILFNTGGTSDDEYRYIITDTLNQLLIPDAGGNIIDYDMVPPIVPEITRIWGVSYTGSFNVSFGSDVTTSALSDSCYQLSTNFITVVRQTPEGGTVSTIDGLTEIVVTPQNEEPDSTTFAKQNTSFGPYIFVVTDENNTILGFSDEADNINFEVYPEQPMRVWGLAYTGNLIALVGDDAAAVALSDDCFDLSDNFVTVNVENGQPQEAQEQTAEDEPLITNDRIIPAPNPAQNWVKLQVEMVDPDSDGVCTSYFQCQWTIGASSYPGCFDGYQYPGVKYQ